MSKDVRKMINLIRSLNENYTNPYVILNHLFGNNYNEIIKNYLNFNY